MGRKKHNGWEKMRQERLEATKEQRAKKAQYSKAWRETMKEHGICAICGHEVALPGLTMCHACREKNHRNRKPVTLTDAQKKRQALFIKQRYNRLKLAGICVICGKNKAEPGLVRCRACRLYANQSARGYVEHTIKYHEKERKAGRT